MRETIRTNGANTIVCLFVHGRNALGMDRSLGDDLVDSAGDRYRLSSTVSRANMVAEGLSSTF